MSSIDAIRQQFRAEKEALSEALTDLQQIDNLIGDSTAKITDAKINTTLRETIAKFNKAIVQTEHLLSPERVGSTLDTFTAKIKTLNDRIETRVKNEVSLPRRVWWAIRGLFGFRPAMMPQFDTKKLTSLVEGRSTELKNAKLLNDDDRAYLITDRTIEQVQDSYDRFKEYFPDKPCVALFPTQTASRIQLLVLEKNKEPQIFNIEHNGATWEMEHASFPSVELIIRHKTQNHVSYPAAFVNIMPAKNHKLEQLREILSKDVISIESLKNVDRGRLNKLYYNERYKTKDSHLYAFGERPDGLQLKVFMPTTPWSEETYEVIATPRDRVILQNAKGQRVFNDINAFKGFLAQMKSLIQTEKLIRNLDEQASQEKTAVNKLINDAFRPLDTVTEADSAETATQRIKELKRYILADNLFLCVRGKNSLELYSKAKGSEQIEFHEIKVAPPHFIVNGKEYKTFEECYRDLKLEPFNQRHFNLYETAKTGISQDQIEQNRTQTLRQEARATRATTAKRAPAPTAKSTTARPEVRARSQAAPQPQVIAEARREILKPDWLDNKGNYLKDASKTNEARLGALGGNWNRLQEAGNQDLYYYIVKRMLAVLKKRENARGAGEIDFLNTAKVHADNLLQIAQNWKTTFPKSKENYDLVVQFLQG